jgi:hypothetical protein
MHGCLRIVKLRKLACIIIVLIFSRVGMLKVLHVQSRLALLFILEVFWWSVSSVSLM